jgi:myo-inositol 2-dehydrogenase/D-chiro-inositol 1-dehydrogenase
MHYVDLMRWFTASEFAEYNALATRMWEQEFEVHFMVQGRMQSGVAFDLHNGFCYTTLAEKPRNWSVVELIGTKGVITARHDFQVATLTVTGSTQSLHEEYPYGGKKLDIYYAQFARGLETGDLGSLPRFEDAVIASRTAQAMVDNALAKPVPNFGEPADTSILPEEKAREAWG